MQRRSDHLRREGRTLAFVPTMGFLHEGHLALMREGRDRADVLVASIYVNPTQFAPSEDFETYPRDFDKDRRLAETIPVDTVVATDPGQGSRIAPGETVGLVLSLGPERYDVPSIVGLTRDEAEAQLDELTLVPGEVTRRYNEEIEQGRVVSQDPAAGTEVRRAAEVSFVLSRGRRPIPATLRNASPARNRRDFRHRPVLRR